VEFMAKGMLLNVAASLELADDFLPPRAKGLKEPREGRGRRGGDREQAREGRE
jgi:hypothetical protein